METLPIAEPNKEEVELAILHSETNRDLAIALHKMIKKAFQETGLMQKYGSEKTIFEVIEKYLEALHPALIDSRNTEKFCTTVKEYFTNPNQGTEWFGQEYSEAILKHCDQITDNTIFINKLNEMYKRSAKPEVPTKQPEKPKAA